MPQRGVALLPLIIILALILGAGIFFWKPAVGPQVSKMSEPEKERISDHCDSFKFSHEFTDLKTISSIIPPVFRNSKGIMPTMLINIKGKVPLYMPTSGKLVQGSYHNEQGVTFYMWEVEAGCGITIVFDHVTDPVEKIKNLFPNAPRNDSRTDPFGVPLEMVGGELVGYTTGSVNAHNLNFAVYSSSEKNYLFEKGEFNDRPKYYTQVCPLKYYDKPVKEAYEKLFVISDKDLSVEKNLCES